MEDSSNATATPTDGTGSSIGTTPASTASAIVSGTAQLQVVQPSADGPSSQLPPTDVGHTRKNKSIAWDHFTKLLNADGTKMEKPRAKCNHCPQTYLVHSKSNGTTSMRNHMLYQYLIGVTHVSVSED